MREAVRQAKSRKIVDAFSFFAWRDQQPEGDAPARRHTEPRGRRAATRGLSDGYYQCLTAEIDCAHLPGMKRGSWRKSNERRRCRLRDEVLDAAAVGAEAAGHLPSTMKPRSTLFGIFVALAVALPSACCPLGKQRITTLTGDRVCATDWVVDFGVCVHHSQGYSKLTTEQRRKVDATISVLGITAETRSDFGRAFSAEFDARPPESVQQIIDTCIKRTSVPDGRDVQQETALIASGGALIGVATAGIGLLIAGVSMVKKAEQDFLAGPAADDRAMANQLGDRGQALAITGAVTAAILLPIGVALVVVGKSGNRRRLDLSILPRFEKHLTGVVFDVRF